MLAAGGVAEGVAVVPEGVAAVAGVPEASGVATGAAATGAVAAGAAAVLGAAVVSAPWAEAAETGRPAVNATAPAIGRRQAMTTLRMMTTQLAEGDSNSEEE